MLGNNNAQHFAILVRMGEALLQIEMMERVLKVCIDFFVPEAGQTWTMLLEQSQEPSRRTLGQFLNELRGRRDIDPDFDAVLRSLLKDRNDFIHNIFSIPGFELETPPEPDKAMKFLTDLSNRAQHVREVLKGYVDIVSEVLGLTDGSKPLDPLNPADFNKIKAAMVIKFK